MAVQYCTAVEKHKESAILGITTPTCTPRSQTSINCSLFICPFVVDLSLCNQCEWHIILHHTGSPFVFWAELSYGLLHRVPDAHTTVHHLRLLILAPTMQTSGSLHMHPAMFQILLASLTHSSTATKLQDKANIAICCLFSSFTTDCTLETGKNPLFPKTTANCTTTTAEQT